MGLPGLRDAIEERLSNQTNNTSIYLLTDAQLRPLLGNLKHWPKEKPSDQGWLSFRIESDSKVHNGNHQALAKAFLLRGNVHLLVGRDILNLEETQALIREALFWGLCITFVLALLGGTMMSRAMMHRIEVINTTCQQIMAGDLSRRIPRTGGEDDFGLLIDNLNRMLDRIEKLMEGVKQVTNNIAHDLRTPLTRLRRRLDMLRENKPADEQSQLLLDQAIDEADGLLVTFRALLRISEVESGSRKRVFRDVDMTAILKDLVELYEPLSEEKNQNLHTKIDAMPLVLGDRDLLFQALANLLDNAIKYTPEGGNISLRIEDTADHIQIIIADSGPGIPSETREKVFERFFRLESSRSTPGNGLGLSLAEAIIKMHNGSIELGDNHPGLVVSIMLPKKGFRIKR
jgi:signal transduction histidine kinase